MADPSAMLPPAAFSLFCAVRRSQTFAFGEFPPLILDKSRKFYVMATFGAVNAISSFVLGACALLRCRVSRPLAACRAVRHCAFAAFGAGEGCEHCACCVFRSGQAALCRVSSCTGRLSDRIGRLPVLGVGFTAFGTVLAILCFWEPAQDQVCCPPYRGAAAALFAAPSPSNTPC